MVLAFSIIPCADSKSFADMNIQYELSQNIQQNTDLEHTDACPPFCICSCCAGFSVINKLQAASAIFIPHQPTHSTHTSIQLYSIALPIWQPPQLVLFLN